MGGSKIKTVDMSESIDETKTKKTNEAGAEGTAIQTSEPRKTRSRSKRYVHLRSQVDKTLTYDIEKAIELVKRLSSKNHPTITADVNHREQGFATEISLPHATGKTLKVVIADEDVLKQIDEGKVDFDVLLAKPDMMGKIAKYARVLGPRGLMPNPKNNTVTANPEARKKELEAGKVSIRTEKKAPLMHVQVGKADQPTEQIIENIVYLVKALGPTKVTKLTISSTMSPGVKVNLGSLIKE